MAFRSHGRDPTIVGAYALQLFQPVPLQDDLIESATVRVHHTLSSPGDTDREWALFMRQRDWAGDPFPGLVVLTVSGVFVAATVIPDGCVRT